MSVSGVQPQAVTGKMGRQYRPDVLFDWGKDIGDHDCTLTMVGVGLQSTPANAAYPTSTFGVAVTAANSHGSITWYNRSVGIQGEVDDHVTGGYSQVRFFFYLTGGTAAAYTTTRIAYSGLPPVSFNFTQNAPSGGISLVIIRLCTTQGVCSRDDDNEFYRSQAS
ncbi:hypothetical protein ACWEOZ_11880 [Actinoplanes sp. NPDC004185]